MLGEVVDVGATYVNDGRPLYWHEEPVEGISETLWLEILKRDADESLANVAFQALCSDNAWTLEVME